MMQGSTSMLGSFILDWDCLVGFVVGIASISSWVYARVAGILRNARMMLSLKQFVSHLVTIGWSFI